MKQSKKQESHIRKVSRQDRNLGADRGLGKFWVLQPSNPFSGAIPDERTVSTFELQVTLIAINAVSEMLML